MSATSTHAAPSEPETSAAASWVATLLPLVLIVVMFLVFLRFLRRSTARAEEGMRLARETVAELRAIRASLELAGTPRPPQQKALEREHTLSGTTTETR
jgi:hypothetical protein